MFLFKLNPQQGFQGPDNTLRRLENNASLVINRLRIIGAVHITILTLPPIPVRGYRHPAYMIWKKYNNFLRTTLGK